MGIVSVAEGGSDAPGVYELGEVEARWQGLWEDGHVSDAASAAETPAGTYYVLQSPPHPREDPPAGQLKSKAFADALTQYHQVRGRWVFTEYPDRALDDVRAPDLPEYVEALQHSLAGRAAGVDLVFGCREADEARALTKTLARIGLVAMEEPYMHALALGMITYDREKPISPEPLYRALWRRHDALLSPLHGSAGSRHRVV